MKVHIKFLAIAIISLFFVSCQFQKDDKQPSETTEVAREVAQDLHEVKVDIKGMTCEIGCAKLIQSKLYKEDGVSFAAVSFADSSGIVRFDKNRISEQDIKSAIEQAAGGGVYTVAAIEEIPLEEESAR